MRRDVEQVLFVKTQDRYRGDLVAESEVHRQVTSEVPVVLHIAAYHRLPDAPIRSRC